jgi:hypothetical protein
LAAAISQAAAKHRHQLMQIVVHPIMQEEKELGWGGFDDVAPALKTTVVLKRMFAPEEVEADPSLREQLQDDVGVEARKFGEADVVPVNTSY